MRKLRTVVCAAVFVLFTITELQAIGPVASPLTNWLPFAMSGFFAVKKDDVTKNKVKPTKPDHPGRQNSRPNLPIGRPIDPLALLSEYVPSPGEWRLVPGTAFADYRLSDRDAARLGIMGDQGSTAVLDDKTGSAYDPDGHKWYFWGGGGTSYGGNEVYQLDLETLEIAMITPPSVLDDAIFDADGVACPIPSVGPSAASSYDGIVWSPFTQTLFLYPTGNFCLDAAATQTSVWEFDPEALTWTAITEIGEIGGYVFAEYDPVTQNIVVVNGAQIASIREFDPITWQHSAPISLGQWLSHGSAVLRIGWGELLLISEEGIHAASLEVPGTIRALTDLPESVDPHSGVVFDPDRGVLVLWGGDKEVRTFDPETLEWTVHTSDSGPTSQGGGIFSKWVYIEELDVFAGYDNVAEGLWLYSMPRRKSGGRNTPSNAAPIADAGPDRTVHSGAFVVLDGIDSFDPDGDDLAFAWELVSRPAESAATLSDPQAVTANFAADVPGTYIARVVVNDGASTSADTVEITSVNTEPVADAGAERTVPVGQIVVLDGSGSSDPDGDPLTYAWTLVSRPAGSTAELSSSSAIGARLMPDVEGSYVAELVVDDGFELSRPDSVTITVVEPQSVRGLTPPPQLVNPTIIKDRCPGTLEFGADEDVLILMPKDKVCKGAMRIDGGRNVRVVGGHFKYTGPGHRGGDKAVIRYGNITDTIFFEGLNLDVNGVETDAINNFGPGNAINSPTKVYVQNSYIHGVNGRRSSVHGDVMEAFSGVDSVVFENVSAFSGYAGLFLPRRPANDTPGATHPVKLGPRNIRLYNVHLGVDTSIVGVERGAVVTRLLYLHDSRVAGTTHNATHDVVTLDNVYVDGQPDWPFWKMIMPTPGTRPAGSIRSEDGKSVTFPPEMNIRGQVREGPPPGGTFVNPRDVGLNYTSPHGLPAQ